MTKVDKISTGKYNLQVFYDMDRLNIHIVDSYKVNNKSDINDCIVEIYEGDLYKEMRRLGYKRGPASMIQEWAAHNYLYEKNYETARTTDVDLDNNESFFRKIGYFFLCLLYRTLPPKAEEKVGAEEKNSAATKDTTKKESGDENKG